MFNTFILFILNALVVLYCNRSKTNNLLDLVWGFLVFMVLLNMAFPSQSFRIFFIVLLQTLLLEYSAMDTEKYIFDFTKTDGIDEWTEQSDTVRDVGMSKAVLVIHQNKAFRRAIFFALLNPQPNGAGFAGIRAVKRYNLTGHTMLQIQCRGQGQYNGFKIVLRHKDLNDEPNYSFEQTFQAPKDEFAVRNLPFTDFKAYYRGKKVNNNESLDLSQISSLGIQVYGGVYLPVKQKGPATLEIDWIKAV